MKPPTEILHLESGLLRDNSTRARSASHPVVSVQDLPKIQTPYVVALPSPDKKLQEERLERYELQRYSPAISLPEGWKPHIHPKGWVYYFHPVARFVTDFKIEYALGLQEFETALSDVEGFPVHHLPENCELWVDYRLEGGKNIAEKLFVDHGRRRLTPREPLHIKGSLTDDGTWQDEEISVYEQLKFEQAYWEYIMNHPCHCALQKTAEEDAKATLMWYLQDRLLNPEDSLAPYSKELTKDLLDALNVTCNENGLYDGTRNRCVKTHLVASILERAAGERLRQHYGQQDARNFLKRRLKLRRDFKAEPSPPPIDFMYKFMMTIVCFGAPYAYLRHINEFFMLGVGRTDTITERWQAFVDENVGDWTNTNLVATVLVSASVALLAIPGIDSTTRIIGITSTLFSIASIVAGLLNIWQHQHKSRTNLELTVIFDFFDKTHRHFKTDNLLAILLSLPMVLLIWSTVMFAVSMVTYAWFGVDETAIEASQDLGSGATDESEGAFRFNLPTAWIATGCLSFLTTLVLMSFLYFWRAWAPSSFRKEDFKEKEAKRKRRWRRLYPF